MPTRAGDLLGRRAVGPAGEPLGRVVDLVCEVDDQGRPRLVAALAVRGPWGRLLGYERAQLRGPWIIETLAGMILRRRTTRVPWESLRWER